MEITALIKRPQMSKVRVVHARLGKIAAASGAAFGNAEKRKVNMHITGIATERRGWKAKRKLGSG